MPSGINSIYLAVEQNRADILEILLKHGADPLAINSNNGESALSLAIKSDKPDLLDTMLKHGPNLTREVQDLLSDFRDVISKGVLDIVERHQQLALQELALKAAKDLTSEQTRPAVSAKDPSEEMTSPRIRGEKRDDWATASSSPFPPHEDAPALYGDELLESLAPLNTTSPRDSASIWVVNPDSPMQPPPTLPSLRGGARDNGSSGDGYGAPIVAVGAVAGALCLGNIVLKACGIRVSKIFSGTKPKDKGKDL